MNFNMFLDILYHAALIAEVMVEACLAAMGIFCVIGAVDAIRMWLKGEFHAH